MRKTVRWFNGHPLTGAALVLGGTVLALFRRALLSPGLLFSVPTGDLAWQFLAWRDFGFSQLRQGHLAFWDPYLYGGAPFFAGFQSALLYPPNWLFLGVPLAAAINFSAALHLFLAGFFTFLWSSRFSPAFLPRLLGAFVFMFGGAFFLHFYPGHLSNICTMAWIPLVFLMLDLYLDSPSLKPLLGGMAALALELLAGHVQYFAYTLLFGGLYGGVRLLLEKEGRLKKALGGAAMALGGLSLGAVQFLPGLLTALADPRVVPDSGPDRLYGSFPWGGLATLLTPGLNGNPDHISGWISTHIWWESSLYIGIAALLLALYGLFAGDGAKRPALLALGLGALVFSLGYHTPLYGWLLDVFPFLRSFRGSFKAAVFFQLSMAALSVTGLGAWLSGKRPSAWPGWTLFFTALALGAAALTMPGVRDLGLRQVLDLNGAPLPDGAPSGWLTLFSAVRAVNLGTAALTGLLLAGLWLGARSRPSLRPLLAWAGILELCFFSFSALPFFDAGPFFEAARGLSQNLAGRVGEGRIYWKDGRDLPLLSGLRDVWGSDPSMPMRYWTFMHQGGNSPPGDDSDILLTPAKERLLRVACRVEQGQGRFRFTWTPGPGLPRALLLDRCRIAQGPQEALKEVLDPSFDPLHEVVVETVPYPPPQKGSRPGRLEVKDLGTDVMEVRAVTERPQVLLVAENYQEGWKAVPFPDSVQQDYRVEPGDFIHRAIPLAPGNHHFLLEYVPPGFALGGWMSLVALGACLWAWVRFGRLPRRPGKPFTPR
jgi:hypothetical protein